MEHEINGFSMTVSVVTCTRWSQWRDGSSFRFVFL